MPAISKAHTYKYTTMFRSPTKFFLEFEKDTLPIHFKNTSLIALKIYFHPSECTINQYKNTNIKPIGMSVIVYDKKQRTKVTHNYTRKQYTELLQHYLVISIDRRCSNKPSDPKKSKLDCLALYQPDYDAKGDFADMPTYDIRPVPVKDHECILTRFAIKPKVIIPESIWDDNVVDSISNCEDL